MIDHPVHSRDRVGFLCALFLAIICGCPAANAFTLEDGSVAPIASSNALDIQGYPLRVWSDEFLRVWVYREIPGEAIGYSQQYETWFRPTLRITRATTTEVCGDHREDGFAFTASNMVRDPDNPAHGIISTVTTDSNNLQIVHQLTYIDGDAFLRHDWTVTNQGPETYTNVALRYGGDSRLGTINDARGFYDAATRTLSCVNSDPSVSGMMSMQAASGTDFAKYIEGLSTSVDTALVAPGNFPSAVNVDKTPSDYTDNGMAVEWGYYTLAPGGTFTVTLFERWTEPGTIQVLAPPGFAAEDGTQHTITFRVQNLGETSQEVTLGLNAPEGWVESYTLAPLTIPAGGTSSVEVEIAIPIGYSVRGISAIELTVGDFDPPQVARVEVEVVSSPITLPTGGDLPLSTASNTVYTGINPCTPDGITSLITSLSGRSPTVTRAFIWDRQLNRYTDFATMIHPAEELRVSAGIFIATREPLAYDLNGSPTNAPFDLTLESAASTWMFAGMPPVQLAQETILTEYTWPSSLTIIHGNYDGNSDSSYVVTQYSFPYNLRQLMGDGDFDGSDISSTIPLWWNGSAYVPAPDSKIVAGRAYWFRNNAAQGDLIIRVESPAQQAQSLKSARTKADAVLARGETASSPFLQAGLRTPTAPPPPPGASGGGSSGGDAASSSKGGGGCGAGSGLGLFGLLLSLIGLRFLAARR